MPEPVRIKEIPENELTAEQAKVIKDLVAGRGRLLTPYKIWIHSPRLAAALETIGTFLNKKGSLSEREVELVICIIANHWKGEYVWTVHARTCVKLGIPQSVFDAIRAGQDPSSTTSASAPSTTSRESRWSRAPARTRCSTAPNGCSAATASPRSWRCWATTARSRWA